MMRWPLSAALALAALAATGSVLSMQGGWLLLLLSVVTAALIRLQPAGKPLKLPSNRVLLGAILFAAFALRLAWIWFVANEPVSDFAVYRELALSLVSGRGYSLTGAAGREEALIYLHQEVSMPYATAWRAPGTALWGALLSFLFGAGAVVFKVANAALATATAWLLYRLGAREGDSRQGLIAALLWALYPASVFSANLYGSETLFAFLLALCAYLLSGQTRGLAAAGLAAAAACLTRSMAPSFLVGAGAAILHGGRRKAASGLGLFLAALILGIAPWTFRNYATLGRFIPICTGGGSVAARHTALLLPREVLESIEFKERWSRWHAISDETGLGKAGYGVAWVNLAEVLRQGPGYTLRVLAGSLSASFATDDDLLQWSVKRVYGALTPSGPESALSADWTQRWLILGQVFYLGLLIVGLWSLVEERGKHESWPAGTRFLAGYCLTAFVLHVVIPGPNRYHMSLMLLPALLAGRRTQASR